MYLMPTHSTTMAHLITTHLAVSITTPLAYSITPAYSKTLATAIMMVAPQSTTLGLSILMAAAQPGTTACSTTPARLVLQMGEPVELEHSITMAPLMILVHRIPIAPRNIIFY